MKRIAVWSFALLGSIGPAAANFCARDVVPAATLLAPYVRVEVDGAGAPVPDGETTILTVTNVASEPQLLHVTVWDALGRPHLDWQVVINGFGTWSVDFADILNGRFDLFDSTNVPAPDAGGITADPFEWGPDGRGRGGSGVGPGSRLGRPAVHSSGAVIDPVRLPLGVPPYGDRPDLAPVIRSALRGPLVSRVHAYNCGGLRGDLSRAPVHDPNEIYFYATVDAVWRQAQVFPDEPGFWVFEGPDRIATMNNVLLGDVVYRDRGRGTLARMPAVHIEANALADESVSGLQFYQEKLGSAPVSTFREPLATAFGIRFLDMRQWQISSNLILWKNFSEVLLNGQVNDCGSYLYYAWDEDGRSQSRSTGYVPGLPVDDGLDPNQFPYATQRVPLNNAHFDLPAAFGWMMLVLPPAYPLTVGRASRYEDPSIGWTNPSIRPYMGWAGVQMTLFGDSAAVEAATLANTHCFPNETLPWMNTNTGGGNGI